MKRERSVLFPLISILFLFSTFCHAQLWSGVLAPSRAIDWSQAGMSGGLPDASWTQCGSTVPAGTDAPTIQTQVNGCAANTYVLLAAGSYTWSNGVSLKNKVVIRGAGANSTLITMSSHGNCNGQYSVFALCGSDPLGNSANWTAGYSQGTTQITLSSVSGIVVGQTFITLDQVDLTSDSGNIWECGSSACGGTYSGGQRTNRSQEQPVLVTAINAGGCGATCVTISPGLYGTNWNAGQTPGAFWGTTTAQQMGVEDLSVDMTPIQSGSVRVSAAVLMNCNQCWVSGIRSVDGGRNHIYLWGTKNAVVRDNYLYESYSHNTQSYAIELYVANGDALIENNICQQMTDSCPNSNGGGAGNVAAYNFAVDNVYNSAGWFQGADNDHGAGNQFWLREGSNTLGLSSDHVHGTHYFTTAFRDFYAGWEAAGCGGPGPNTCTGNTQAVNPFAGSRYFNVVGSVLGAANYYTNYSTTSPGSANSSIYYLGGTNFGGNGTGTFCAQPACTSTTTTTDPLTQTSIMRWGNYDTVTSQVRWCTANATPIAACTGDERAGAFGDTTGTPSTYAALSSPTQTLPNSFYLAGTVKTTSATPCGSGVRFNMNPSLGTCAPYPYFGPDVTSGTLGVCSGGTYANSYATSSSQCTGGTLATALGGHANANPAQVCYLSVMNGPPDGTGSVLTFDRASCYANDPSSSGPPAPPTGLAAAVK
jgi:hypothetical protein